MTVDNLAENGTIVSELYSALREGEAGLKYVPMLLKRILEGECWRKRVIPQTGELAEFDDFGEFVIAMPPEGLGAELDLIWRICGDDIEVQAMLADVGVRGPGGANNPLGLGGRSGKTANGHDIVNRYNVTIDKEVAGRGHRRKYALRRLKRDRPDLLQRVLDQELSPHAAMVKAGFLKPQMTIIVEPEAVVRALGRRFGRQELAIIRDGLTELLGSNEIREIARS